MERLVADLGGDPTQAAQAALAVCMLCAREAAPPSSLVAAVEPLVALLGSEHSAALQQNACAALSGLCAAVAGAREEVAAHGGAQRICALLRLTGAVRANALETAAVLAAGGGLGLDAVLVADIPSTVVALLQSAVDGSDAEAAADVLCSLAAEPPARPALLQAGAVPLLAELMQHGSAELRMRALLCLSMILALRPAAHAFLAVPGALAKLRSLAAAGAAASCGGPEDDDALVWQQGLDETSLVAADVLSALLQDAEIGPLAAAA